MSPKTPRGNRPARWSHFVQLLVVLVCSAALKQYYSTASVNQLRWVLAPTTFLVQLISGTRFQFESHAGYIKSDRTFLIAASCAGVNFLITAFLLLSLRKLWRDRAVSPSWKFIPVTAVVAYVVTIIANTVRISIALHSLHHESSWLSANQLHRFQGIFIYFGFLLLLFLLSEQKGERSTRDNPSALVTGRLTLIRRLSLPLFVYYLTTLGIPLVNGAYQDGDFWEHAGFVLVTPLFLIFLCAITASSLRWLCLKSLSVVRLCRTSDGIPESTLPNYSGKPAGDDFTQLPLAMNQN
jgi:exosortase K